MKTHLVSEKVRILDYTISDQQGTFFSPQKYVINEKLNLLKLFLKGTFNLSTEPPLENIFQLTVT